MAHGRVPGDQLDALQAERIGRRLARAINATRANDLPQEGLGALLLSVFDLLLYGLWALGLLVAALAGLALVSEEPAWPLLVMAALAGGAVAAVIVLPMLLGWLSFRRSTRDRVIMLIMMMAGEIVLIGAWLAIANASA